MILTTQEWSEVFRSAFRVEAVAGRFISLGFRWKTNRRQGKGGGIR